MSRRLPVPRFIGASVTARPPMVGEVLRPEHYLEIGLMPDGREIVINFPGDAYTPAHHTVFSADQARNLARLLMRKADECSTCVPCGVVSGKGEVIDVAPEEGLLERIRDLEGVVARKSALINKLVLEMHRRQEAAKR